MVQALGNQLLAGAALADYQHRPVQGRRAARPLDRIEERKALPDELVRAFHLLSFKNLTDCWWRIPPFGKDFRAFHSPKFGKITELQAFLNFGTALV
jgi:hypothetical protein